MNLSLRYRALVGALLASALTTLPCAFAQESRTVQADTLFWERVGTLSDVQGLFFDDDTLYAIPIGDSFQVLRPDDVDFSQAFSSDGLRAKDLLIMSDRAIFTLSSSASGGGRSVDWGQTWETTHKDAFTLPLPTPEGAFVLGTRGSASDGGRLAARSTDDGATWISHGLGEGTDGLGTTNLVVIPPSPDFPAGRIVATGFGGIAYSDDDGRSWTATALYGGIAYAAWSSARIPVGPHAGRLLAVVERGQPGGEPTGLYASSDGATWTRIGNIPGGGARGAELLAAPDGAVYVYQSNTDGWPVWRSLDGGQSWVNLGPVWTEWPAEPREIVVGPDGRLWAACSGGGFAGFDGGVFRTVLPAVASEEGPGDLGSLVIELTVHPNPMLRAATVAVLLHEAAEVRVAVFDVLGRRVTGLHDGVLAAGEHRFSLNSARLPAGVYVVRATGDGFDTSQRLTVAR